MKYKVLFTEKFKKEIKKIDKHNAYIITKWIRKNLVDCENPRQYGKSLVGNLSRKWRYRVGDYRIIADIRDDEIVILLVNVGHRRYIYE